MTHTRQPIALVNVDLTVADLRAVFERHLPKDRLDGYRLPIRDFNKPVIIGLSGGADSAVLALFAAVYLRPIYPNIRCVFTDTGAEPDSCYETLDRLAQVTGLPVVRLTPELGLFGLINAYGGFLPSSKSRYCTRELKIKPLMAYLKGQYADTDYINLAGIRVDEADRDGIQFQVSMDHDARAAFPFVDLEVTKAIVFAILDETIGIPETYRFRSRSGCSACFFQRSAEHIGLLLNDYPRFIEAEGLEKLNGADATRWANTPSPATELGIAATYPVPKFVDVRAAPCVPDTPPAKKRAPYKHQADLFGDNEADGAEDLFVAFALYTDARLSWFGGREFTPGTYWQELVTVSPSLAGLKVSLGHYYRYRKTTPLPHIDADDLQIVLVQIRFRKGVIDIRPPSEASYTWKSGVAMRQLRHLAKHAQAVLQSTALERSLVEFEEKASEGDVWAEEQLDSLRSSTNRLPERQGEVLWEGLYTPAAEVAETVQLELQGVSVQSKPTPAREGLEFDEVPRACIACSL